MEAATVLEITPETLRERAQSCRDRAVAMREEYMRLLTEAARLEREADALAEAYRLRREDIPEPTGRSALAGEIAAYLARCRNPKSSSEIADHFGVSTGRARGALELLVEIGMVYRSGLKRGTRYRILRDGEDPPDEPRPFGDRWHEHVRDVAIELQTFTMAEIVERIPEVSAQTIYRWLRRLVDDGVLSVERVGAANVFAYERPDASAAVPVVASKAPARARRTVAGTGRSRSGRREVDEILRIAKAAGAEIKPQKHGYAVVVEGQVVESIPRTPSDHRSLKNARRSLNRHGIRA